MDIFQLKQHIQTPTRVTPTTSSLIDVNFTYIGDNGTLEAGVLHLGVTDFETLKFKIREVLESYYLEGNKISCTLEVYKNYHAIKAKLIDNVFESMHGSINPDLVSHFMPFFRSSHDDRTNRTDAPLRSACLLDFL